MNETHVTILIVDDEESIHRALERTLRHEPYDVLHAADTAEAEAILSQRPDVRAVVCDHYMPGVSGLDFLLHQRRVRPGLITILLTAQADIRMVITALNEGRLHLFLTKPWDGDELRTALRRLLRLDPLASRAAADLARRDEGRLRRTMAPRQDEHGAYLIEAPGAPGAPGAIPIGKPANTPPAVPEA